MSKIVSICTKKTKVVFDVLNVALDGHLLHELEDDHDLRHFASVLQKSRNGALSIET